MLQEDTMNGTLRSLAAELDALGRDALAASTMQTPPATSVAIASSFNIFILLVCCLPIEVKKKTRTV